MSVTLEAYPGIKKASDRDSTETIAAAMKSLVRPGSGHIGCTEALAVALGLPGSRLIELRSVPCGVSGQRLMALRYLVKNGGVWLKYFSYEQRLAKLDPTAPEKALRLWQEIEQVREKLPKEDAFQKRLEKTKLAKIPEKLRFTNEGAIDFEYKESLPLIVGLTVYDQARKELRARLSREAHELLREAPAVSDVLYLLSQDLERLPATTVFGGKLDYVIVADKGEMGVRAVREVIKMGKTPVVVYSEQDDSRSLQVRLAQGAGGIAIPLSGSFRETYANPSQIAERVEKVYKERFGDDAEALLARSALYPGYGPLAENTAAIEIFRRSGIAFIGPMQDVVERAGDKRKFRLLAEAIDPKAVTPGIVMDDSDEARIIGAIEQGKKERKFEFPGRLKAANGGGGRGQVVIRTPEEVPAAVTKVLNEIQANGWDQGVMFEQNIFQTTHLEVQVLRDRFGNTRHFGMRDCSEQRASQKIQEEAPPALLADKPALEERMCEIAVRIADAVGYVGAATVELMYKDGHFYLLEMNTRIQVEHPVTEEAHRIRRGSELVPLNLVQLQIEVASGKALDFAQEDIVLTHVAREFRINAESYKPDVKDPRDGKKGLFLPNAGVFDVIVVPDAGEVKRALLAAGVSGIEEIFVRFDSGFEVGDDLVNKDPTFAKLIVSVAPTKDGQARRFELLRLASIEVLSRLKIEGRQLLPNGKVLEDRPLETNIQDHIHVLQTDMLKRHSAGSAPDRHVNWLIEMLRASHAAE
jgi:acetyl/propionyl-CoA carboxylase alpha subunit